MSLRPYLQHNPQVEGLGYEDQDLMYANKGYEEGIGKVIKLLTKLKISSKPTLEI